MTQRFRKWYYDDTDDDDDYMDNDNYFCSTPKSKQIEPLALVQQKLNCAVNKPNLNKHNEQF